MPIWIRTTTDIPTFGNTFRERLHRLEISAEPSPNAWELANGLNSFDDSDAQIDSDLDGLSARLEYLYGGDVNQSDTDDDGMNDFLEMIAGTRLSDSASLLESRIEVSP